ncbi:hypothetical protein IE4872_CH01876 [Rhizobium gallicum]|uniref:Integrase catalytic domain-containing protein n=1 Tax=Rhizobium gallicum TaxID=56730 RepID=A0A1L5NHY6_9HYPH|nr:hypothetical protein IE4872_CH01876 [Rhizobium gallicum]
MGNSGWLRLFPRYEDAIARTMEIVARCRFSLEELTLARELDRIIEERGKPRMIVSANGSEFTSNAILQWTDQAKVDWHYLPPGKPVQNAQGQSRRAFNTFSPFVAVGVQRRPFILTLVDFA